MKLLEQRVPYSSIDFQNREGTMRIPDEDLVRLVVWASKEVYCYKVSNIQRDVAIKFNFIPF